MRLPVWSGDTQWGPISDVKSRRPTRAAAEYTERAHLSGYYGQGLHGMDYLMYAMLQTARDDEARELLSELLNVGKTDTEDFAVAFAYASAPARYVLERRQFDKFATKVKS